MIRCAKCGRMTNDAWTDDKRNRFCSEKCRDSKDDAVNHPKHYASHPSGIECIEITRHMTFNCGNAMKYLWRNGLKDGAPSIQDLEKAIWYIKDEITLINKGETKNV